MSVNSKISDSFLKIWKSVLNLAEVIKKTPGILTYFINWEKKDLKDISKLNNKNFKFYVWETKKYEKDQFYSENFYIWAIANLIDLLENGWSLDIEVWADVSKIMNENWEVSNSMTTQEQIEFIREIIRKNFKKFENKINIINTSKRHPELFQELEQNWLDWLNSDKNELELWEKFKSLDIAKLLYGACKENEIFFNKIKWTRPEKIKENDLEKPKYYSIIEIAFRFTDYINWINIHGWERRQERYDVIIRWIINWDYNHIPTIKKIYNFLQTRQNLWTFGSLHFNKKIFEKELEETKKIKKWKIINLIWMVSLSVWFILTWVSDCKQKKVYCISERQKSLILDILHWVSLTQYIWWVWNQEYTTEDQKNERINYLWEKLVGLFIRRYWEWDFEVEKLQLFFILKIIELKEYSFNEMNYWDKLYLRLIDEILDDSINKTKLVSYWFNVDNNYWKYIEYKEDFSNTYKSDIELELDESDVKKIWEYMSKDWTPSDIALYKKDWKKYIVARNYSYGKYSFEKAKVVSLDFLWTPFNYFSTLLMKTWSSIWDDFYHLDEQIIKFLVDKVISWETNVKDIKNWNLIDKIDFLYKNFPDKFSFDLKEVLNNTINMPQVLVDEIVKNKMSLFFTKVWIYTLDEKDKLEYSVYVYEYKQKRYFILDMWWDNFWESLKIYLNESRFSDWKEFAKKLLKLL